MGNVNIRGSGYIDDTSFLRWMQLFVATVGCTKEAPHILLLDGHESHKSLDVIMYTRDNGVVMLSFPPHCTHRLQPLDCTFFRSLKAGLSRACDNWMTSNKGRPLSQFDLIPLFNHAYNSAATVVLATKGFSTIGLWPFDDSKFDEELARSTAQDEDAAQAEAIAATRTDNVEVVRARDDRPTEIPQRVTVVADVHALDDASVIIQPAPSDDVAETGLPAAPITEGQEAVRRVKVHAAPCVAIHDAEAMQIVSAEVVA